MINLLTFGLILNLSNISRNALNGGLVFIKDIDVATIVGLNMTKFSNSTGFILLKKQFCNNLLQRKTNQN